MIERLVLASGEERRLGVLSYAVIAWACLSIVVALFWSDRPAYDVAGKLTYWAIVAAPFAVLAAILRRRANRAASLLANLKPLWWSTFALAALCSGGWYDGPGSRPVVFLVWFGASLVGVVTALLLLRAAWLAAPRQASIG